VGPSGCLGGIWEIIFSVPVRARAFRWVARVIGSFCGRSARKGASSSSSSGTDECGLRAARARRESSQRAWSAALR
jgi:hypothetical protein